MPKLESPTGAQIARVALVGNPNAGKTTVFNALTGSFQKVGNYPGVTVEKVEGAFTQGGKRYHLIDVPGLYSLDVVSEDEQVARDVLAGTGTQESKPDLLICVMDGNNLERNLFLFSQLAELGLPIVCAMTMTDVAKDKGVEIDDAHLSRLLGVPVIRIVGHKGEGVAQLKDAVSHALLERPTASAIRTKLLSDLRDSFARAGYDYSTEQLESEVAHRPEKLLSDAEPFPEIQDLLTRIRSNQIEPRDRYKWAESITQEVVRVSEAHRIKRRSDALDRIVTHRVFGLAIFVAVMYVMFQSIYTLAAPIMDWIEGGFAALSTWVGPMVESNEILASFLTDGLITGVGSVVVFLPQILILFFFISVLEGSGYLARAAFLMDRSLGWCGLNGRAFIPLLSSFACAIPGIMAARVMPDQRSRLATILVAPLMSCSARLPVYLLLIGAFIEPRFGPAWAGFTLFAMHFMGLIVAIPVVLILNRRVIKGKRLPFVLEMPPYQWPKWKDVALTLLNRAKVFLKIAGTIILFMSMVVWALLYFPRSDADEVAYRSAYASLSEDVKQSISEENFILERQTENSYLGRFGKFIEPVFVPAGFDWRISTGILAAFPAREVVVPTLGIIFTVGSDADEESESLRSQLVSAKWPDGRPLMTPWTAIGLMAFFALCAQCMATLATVRRETGSWKWPLFMFTYMTALAYVAAVAIHQLSRLF
ncbi:MAG: ferrous iron transport protein B [Fimbriimonadales bacterium]|nr:ferrous iron transport protein B [Fimbriimonadales bacterium]